MSGGDDDDDDDDDKKKKKKKKSSSFLPDWLSNLFGGFDLWSILITLAVVTGVYFLVHNEKIQAFASKWFDLKGAVDKMDAWIGENAPPWLANLLGVGDAAGKMLEGMDAAAAQKFMIEQIDKDATPAQKQAAIETAQILTFNEKTWKGYLATAKEANDKHLTKDSLTNDKTVFQLLITKDPDLKVMVNKLFSAVQTDGTGDAKMSKAVMTSLLAIVNDETRLNALFSAANRKTTLTLLMKKAPQMTQGIDAIDKAIMKEEFDPATGKLKPEFQKALVAALTPDANGKLDFKPFEDLLFKDLQKTPEGKKLISESIVTQATPIFGKENSEKLSVLLDALEKKEAGQKEAFLAAFKVKTDKDATADAKKEADDTITSLITANFELCNNFAKKLDLSTITDPEIKKQMEELAKVTPQQADDQKKLLDNKVDTKAVTNLFLADDRFEDKNGVVWTIKQQEQTGKDGKKIVWYVMQNKDGHILENKDGPLYVMQNEKGEPLADNGLLSLMDKNLHPVTLTDVKRVPFTANEAVLRLLETTTRETMGVEGSNPKRAENITHLANLMAGKIDDEQMKKLLTPNNFDAILTAAETLDKHAEALNGKTTDNSKTRFYSEEENKVLTAFVNIAFAKTPEERKLACDGLKSETVAAFFQDKTCADAVKNLLAHLKDLGPQQTMVNMLVSQWGTLEKDDKRKRVEDRDGEGLVEVLADPEGAKLVLDALQGKEPDMSHAPWWVRGWKNLCDSAPGGGGKPSAEKQHEYLTKYAAPKVIENAPYMEEIVKMLASVSDAKDVKSGSHVTPSTPSTPKNTGIFNGFFDNISFPLG